MLIPRRGLIKGAAAMAAYAALEERARALPGPFPVASFSSANLPPTTNTFDATSAGSGIALSNSNKTATGNAVAAWNSVKLVTGKSSGKWYSEFHVDVATSQYVVFGVCDGSASAFVGNYLGTFTNTAGVLYGFLNYQDGFTNANVPTMPLYVAGDIVAVAFDITAKQVFFAKNNAWSNGGVPSTGANPTFTWSGTYTIYPAISLYDNTDVVTYQQSLTYTPPSGFSPL